MTEIKHAIVGTDGAFLLQAAGAKENAIELSGKDDGDVWLFDEKGRPLQFSFLRPGLMEAGRPVEAETLPGKRIAGTFVGLSDLGVIIRTNGGDVVVAKRALAQLNLPEATPLPVVSFERAVGGQPTRGILDGRGRPAAADRKSVSLDARQRQDANILPENSRSVFLRYRTPNIAAKIRTLFTVTSGRAGLARNAENGISAVTVVELQNHSEKSWFLKTVSVVAHAVRAESGRFHEALSFSKAPPGSEVENPRSPSHADVFTAVMSDVPLDAYSTFSAPLDAWNFDCRFVTVVDAHYSGWSWSNPIGLSTPETSALITSRDDRLFPGGRTTVISDDAEISDVVTPQLVAGENMLLSLFPNQRATARVENVRVLAPSKQVSIVQSRSDGSAGPMQEEMRIVDFDFVVEIRQARSEEQVLLGLAEEVLEGGTPLRTKEGGVYYRITLPAGSKVASKTRFRIRVPAPSQ